MKRQPIWDSGDGVSVVASPEDSGIKFLHRQNGSVIWVSEAEARRVCIALSNYLLDLIERCG